MGDVLATYLVHSKPTDFVQKAEGIALGLTVGTWTNLPHLEQEQLKKHKGRVVSIEPLGESEQAENLFGGKMEKALITIAYPSANFSLDIPAILTTIFGKLSLDGMIKLYDIELTDDLLSTFPGPRFGIEGVREILGVHNRPLVMSIFKGMIGKGLDEHRNQLEKQALGGVDLVKDDEILFDNPLTPFEERVMAGKAILDKVEQRTGHKTLYAVNLTGRTFDLIEKAKRAVDLGASALLFNVFAYGLDVLQALAENEDIGVPILAHPAVSGAMTPSPFYGISNKVLLGKLTRLAGADLVLFPSPYGSVALDKEETLDIASALTEESPYKKAFPVPSAGIFPGLVPLLVEDFGENCVINAGGGVHGHPDGADAGGKAFRQAIDTVLAGKSLEEGVQNHAALKTAIDMWGIPRGVNT